MNSFRGWEIPARVGAKLQNRVTIAIACLTLLASTALAGCNSYNPPPYTPPPVKPTVVFQAGGWNNGNLSLTIAAASNAASLAPANLTYLILDQPGTAYYSGAANTPQTTGPVTVIVYYNDTVEVGAVSAGDGLRIQVVPSTATQLYGASLKAYSGGEPIGTAMLP